MVLTDKQKLFMEGLINFESYNIESFIKNLVLPAVRVEYKEEFCIFFEQKVETFLRDDAAINFPIVEFSECGEDCNGLLNLMALAKEDDKKTFYETAITVLFAIPAIQASIDRLVEVHESDKKITLCNKLITSYLYELHRGNTANANKLRIAIILTDSRYEGYSDDKFREEIESRETYLGTFFGSYLSDTSDSEEEREFIAKPFPQRQEIERKSVKLAEKAACDKIVYKNKTKRAEKGDLRIAKDDPSDLFNKGTRINIKRSENSKQLERIKKDLAALNMAHEDCDGNPEKFAKSIDQLRTKFFIAQYRGITYLTTRWSQKERRLHRKFNEVNLPVFSMAAYRRAKLIPSDLADLAQQVQHVERLTKAAEGIKKTVILTRNKKKFAYNKRTYDSLADLLQELYTTKYAQFHITLEEHETLQILFPEAANPFISTGDRPYMH